MLGVAGDGLERDPAVGAGQQQALAAAGGEQELPFPGRQPEGLGHEADGLGCLAEQDLGGGVGDDGAAELAAEDVLGVLGDDGERGPVLAGGLGHPVQERRAVGLAHQQPRLVDDHQPAAGRAGRW